MSELVGILAVAVLFILFCALPPRRRGDGCPGCNAGEDGDRQGCSVCPHTTERSASMEVRAPQ
jgi:hypothetical protein